MWTQGSFNSFLLSAQMKYLEGNIFINFYMFGLAGFIAVLIGGVVFSSYGLRFTYVVSFNMCIFGCIGMLVIQMKLISFSSQAAMETFNEQFMPVFILLLKMGIIISFITTTQVSFTDDRIFPSNKRNTSVGTCGMIARSITIMAPIVNEWPAPWPILSILFFSIVGILMTFTFPSQEEKLRKEIITLNDRLEDGSNLSYHNISKELKFNDEQEKATQSTHFGH